MYETRQEVKSSILKMGSENKNWFRGTWTGGICSQQVPSEISGLVFWLLENEVKIDSFLEIGSAAGGNVFIFDHFFKPKTIRLIDNNSQPRCKLRPKILKDILYEEFVGDSQTVDARNFAATHNYDFIFIDADHSYNAVKSDINFYSPLASQYIAFHDYFQCVGVNQAVNEWRQNNNFKCVKIFGSKQKVGIILFQNMGNDEK